MDYTWLFVNSYKLNQIHMKNPNIYFRTLILLIAILIIPNISFSGIYYDNKTVKEFSACEISTADFYVPGQTSILNFTLMFESFDGENIDQLTLSFPAGFTITGNASQQVGEPFSGQDPEILFNFNTLSITWGDNDNSFGGIESGIWDFFVEVSVDQGVSGNLTGTFVASGDGSTGMESLFEDLFIINSIPSPDIYVQLVNDFRQYTIVPFQQFSAVQPVVQVGNLGAATQSDFQISIECPQLAYNESVNISSPFSYNSQSEITFSGNLFTDSPGAIDIFIGSNCAEDNFNSNDADTVHLELSDSIMARENWVSNGEAGLGNGIYGSTGQQFDIASTALLTSVTFAINSDMFDDYTRVDIYDDAGGQPGNIIATSGDIQLGYDLDTTVALLSPIQVDPGRYYVMIFEPVEVDALGLKYTTDYYTPGAAWLSYNGGSWLHPEQVGVELTYLLRLNMNTLPTADEYLRPLNSEILIFPNPADNCITINVDGGVNYEIISIDGRILSDGIASNSMVINTTDLPNGVYMIRITSDHGSNSRKFIISR